MPDQTGKTAIVTGANTGIGYETALGLYEAGAHVVLACRNSENAAQAKSKMEIIPGKGSIETAVLDLSSLASVKQFTTVFKQQHSRLDILVNNAGVMLPPAAKTAEGYELQFGVNFLGHFALTGQLFPLLKTTPGARIVTLSSLAYVRGEIDFDNLRLEKPYDRMQSYAQSKLADLVFTVELQRRLTDLAIPVISVAAHPGATQTELIRHMSEEEFRVALEHFGLLMDAAQGSLSTLYGAVSPDVKPGAFCAPDQDGGIRGFPTQAEILPHALDKVVAQKLWDFAEKATGIVFPA